MESGTLDIAGIIKWGASKAYDYVEQKTNLPAMALHGALTPLVEKGIEHFGLTQALEIDLPLMALGRLAIAGIQRQKEMEAQRRANDVRNNS